MPNLSFNTLAIGAKQLVVQEALETNCMSLVYLSRFTPQTNMGVSSFEGADITTFLAPASMWPLAFSLSRNKPVDSTTYSAPTDRKSTRLNSSHVRISYAVF